MRKSRSSVSREKLGELDSHGANVSLAEKRGGANDH